MQVVFHLGAHCTDEERLVRALLRARSELAPQGIVVPAPSRYRAVIRETLVKLKGTPASRDVQEVILDAVMDEDQARRLVLSHEFFICIPQRVVNEGAFYPIAGRKVAALANIFPEAECEFALALRNPATLIPALMQRLGPVDYADFMGSAHPTHLRWLPVIEQILAAVPGRRLTVWCNEDTPLIWPEVLRAVAGCPAETPLAGDIDLLATLMPRDGLRRLEAYLELHRPRTPELRRKIVAAFLGKFALQDDLEMVVELPGWTEEMIETMTSQYDADVAAIAQLPGVTFLGS